MIGHRYLETMFAVKKAIQTSFLKLAPNNKDLLCICGSWHRISNWKLCYTRTQKNVFFSPFFLQDVRHAKKNFFECVMMLNFVMCIFCHKKKENSRVLLEGLIVSKQNHTVMENEIILVFHLSQECTRNQNFIISTVKQSRWSTTLNSEDL